MIENGRIQLVNEYTQEQALLDLVFTDCNDSVVDVMICEPFLTSDHSMIWFHFMLLGHLNPAHVIEPEAQFNYARADWDAVNLALSNVNWHALVNDRVPIENAWRSFYKCINDAISITIPKKSQLRRDSKQAYMRYPKSLKRLRSIKLDKGHHDDAQLKASYKVATSNFNRAIHQ